jgi:hypothetical protein
MKKTLKEYYIERTDISYCVVTASSPEEATIMSGNGNLSINWETIVGEEIVTENEIEEWTN